MLRRLFDKGNQSLSHFCSISKSGNQDKSNFNILKIYELRHFWMNLWALLNLFEFFSLNSPYCVPGSTRFRWVEVPLDLMPLVDIQQVGGNASLAEAMEPGCHDRAVRYPRKWKFAICSLDIYRPNTDSGICQTGSKWPDNYFFPTTSAGKNVCICLCGSVANSKSIFTVKWESISPRFCQVLRLQQTKTLCPDPG